MINFDFDNEEYKRILDAVHLTDEEIVILELKRRGMADLDIGFEINKSRNTVIAKKKKIYDKICKYIARGK